MKIKHAFCGFILLTFLSHGGLAQATNYNLVPIADIPSPEAFKGFKDNLDYTSMPLDLNKLVKIPLSCENKFLYPTHPEQLTKQYHIYQTGGYDLVKLAFNSEACLLPSKYKNSKGQFYCQLNDFLESTVISDSYKDSCGNFYRGFWRVTFLRKNDNMGTLYSLGRTMYPKANSELENDFEPGGTYPVPEKSFLFLTPLFSTDKKDSTSPLLFN